jgi:hypothetical protein
MLVTNAFLPTLHITDTAGDEKNECYTSVLTSVDYIERVDPNLHPIDLLYGLRLSLLVGVLKVFIVVSNSYFF